MIESEFLSLESLTALTLPTYRTARARHDWNTTWVRLSRRGFLPPLKHWCRLIAGPAPGGALYDKFGFRAPFIYCIALALFDIIGRILVIERKEALKWGFDPANSHLSIQQQSSQDHRADKDGAIELADLPGSDMPKVDVEQSNLEGGRNEKELPETLEGHSKLSIAKVILLMIKSPRTLVASCATVAVAYVCIKIIECS